MPTSVWDRLKNPNPSGFDTLKQPSSLTPRLPLGSPFPNTGDPNAQALTASRNRLQTRGGIVNLSDPNNPFQRRQTQADFDVLGAEMGLAPYRGAVRGARGALLEKQRASDAYGRGMLDRLRGDINAGAQESTNLRTAANDVNDINAVAQATMARGADDAIYDMLGVSRPVTVNAPRDATGFAPGVRAALRSNASYLSDEYEANAEGRQVRQQLDDLEAKRLGYDVTDASRGVSAADLALDAAGETVTGARQRSQLAKLLYGQESDRLNYADDLAALESDRVKLAPRSGLDIYENPDGSSEWLTPGEIEQRNYDRRMSLSDERYPAEEARRQQREDERYPEDERRRQERELANLPRTIQVQQIREKAQRDARLKESPFNGFDDTDIARYLYEGQFFEPWNNRPAEILQYLTDKYGLQAAQIKMRQYEEAAKKAPAGSAASADPKITGPAFGP